MCFLIRRKFRSAQGERHNSRTWVAQPVHSYNGTHLGSLFLLFGIIRSRDITKVSPQQCIRVISADYAKCCQADTCAFVEASIGDATTTTNKQRTHSCINLDPDGQRQGNIACFDLITGSVLSVANPT